MVTIGEIPRNMLYLSKGKIFKYPNYIIIDKDKQSADETLKKYIENLQYAINFFVIDSRGSGEWLVKENNEIIANYKHAIEVLESDLKAGCVEI